MIRLTPRSRAHLPPPPPLTRRRRRCTFASLRRRHEQRARARAGHRHAARGQRRVRALLRHVQRGGEGRGAGQRLQRLPSASRRVPHPALLLPAQPHDPPHRSAPARVCRRSAARLTRWRGPAAARGRRTTRSWWGGTGAAPGGADGEQSTNVTWQAPHNARCPQARPLPQPRRCGAARAPPTAAPPLAPPRRSGRIVGIPSGELLFYALGTREYNELAREWCRTAGLTASASAATPDWLHCCAVCASE